MRVGAFAGLAFMHIPVLVIILYAFTTEDRTYQFPPPGLTLRWFEVAFARADIWQALTPVARRGGLRNGASRWCWARSPHSRWRAADFRGKDALTVLFVLPIALPGIITGIALLAAMKLGRHRAVVPHHRCRPRDVLHSSSSTTTWSRACAGCRRAGSRPPWTWAPMARRRLRYVLLPQVATAFLAGGMLAFALSFDEIIVTIFTAGNERTLPIWFFNELFRPRDRPVTNVVAVIVIAVTLMPIVLAYYLTRPDDEHETAH